MSESVYFKSPDEGMVAAFAKQDPLRQRQRDSLQSDEARRQYDEYLQSNLHQVKQLTRKDASTIVRLWDVGKVCSRDVSAEKITVEVVSGRNKGKRLVVNEADTRVHDQSHDDQCEDVALISDFSEVPLLRCLRRRFLNLNIYTYVSDIIIVLNPYFRIPAANIIPSPLPNFFPSENPHVYASAHFAYHQQLDTKAEPRSQSIVVSGESGAGKTVACKMVMAYLAKLSEASISNENGNRPRRSSVVQNVSCYACLYGTEK